MLLGGDGGVELGHLRPGPRCAARCPRRNPSAYVGTSTGLGTPVAILSIPLWIALAELLIGV